MNNNVAIPDNVLKSIPKEFLNHDVVFFTQADMDNECNFRRHILILYFDFLLVGRSKEITPIVERGTDIKPQKWDMSSFEWQSFKLSDINETYIEKFVVGGMLCLNLTESIRPIACFTNGFNGKIKRLCRYIKAINNGEDINESKFQEKENEAFCPKCGMPYPDKNRKICPKCMDKRSVFMRMFSYFYKYKFALALISLFCILTALFNSIWPYLNGTLLYDGVLAKKPDALPFINLDNPAVLLAVLALTMVIAKLIQQLLGVFQGILVAKVVPKVICKVKNDVFNSIQTLSVSFFTNKQTGGLMTRIVEDANSVSDVFIDGLPYIIPNLLTIIFSCVVMFSTNLILALVAVFVLPILLIICVKLDPIMWHYNSRQHQTSRNMRARINDNLVGARVVKAFGKQSEENMRFEKVNDSVYDAHIDQVNFNTKYNLIYYVAKRLSVVLVWGFGSLFVLNLFNSDMTYGTLVTFVGYVSMLAGPIDFFSYIFRWWSSSMNSAQRIFEIMDAKPDVVEKKETINSPILDGEIRIENLTFSYEENKDVLKNISLHIPSGKMLGIVGKSGAGKSTLVNLISRLYDPKEGDIYLSGYNLRDLSFADVRKSIAMVSQETYIFKGTIFDNIAYANKDASKEDVINAAISASAHDFICKLPDGYDTIVGAGGRQLSGGERQRISIARAVLANPKILILDEATAAVDTETERNIQAALSELIKGRTTLSIAHRLSTLRDADFLVVFENGEIVERGTHEELFKQKGTYYKLLQIQSKALAMRGISE